MTRARALLLSLVVGLPLAKWIQIRYFPGDDYVRQALLVFVSATAIVAAVGLGRAPKAFLTWHRGPAALTADWRWARGAQGLAILGLDGLAGLAVFVGSAGWVIASAAGGALTLLVVLAISERGRAVGLAAGDSLPDRAVLWTVAPATLIWAVPLVVASVMGHRLGSPPANPDACSIGPSGAGGQALCTAVVIGFGEEYLYRGLLLVLAVKAALGRFSVVVVSLAFGLWHIPDALNRHGSFQHRLFAAVGFAAATFALGQFILMPLRLRSRSVAGPALLHAANNVLLNLL